MGKIVRAGIPSTH